MLLAVLLIAGGIATLSHVAPFPFLLDLMTGNISVWRMPSTGGAKEIYLTFDDGPNPTATPALLDLLRERDIRATFFLIDDYVNEATAPIVRRMFDEGHTVGQHTGDRWLLVRSPNTVAMRLQTAARKIEMLTGKRPCALFRPHAGWRSISMLRGMRRAGYKLAGWSWMSWDWIWFRKRTGPRVAAHLAAHAAPGKIIVIHDGHHRNPRADRGYAIEATALLIERLSAQGYRFRSMCESN
jgi:peptidoglycan/xylan/chitin deacetylase (PgdA/CDA1 family)